MAAAKKLTIIDKSGTLPGLNFNVRYEKMDRAKKLEIDHVVELLGPGNKVEYAVPVKYVPIFDQPAPSPAPAPATLECVSVPEPAMSSVAEAGPYKKAWMDAAGTIYAAEEIKHYYQAQECAEKTKTTIFEILEFQPIVKYNNDYVIDKYYEAWPDEDGRKKESDKDAARRKNLIGMRLLWEHLQERQAVARGEFNVSSGGFLATDGYVRAVGFGNKWGLELSILKEEKVFQHLQEGIPAAVMAAISTNGPIKIKRV